jgi:hypothetical protein
MDIICDAERTLISRPWRHDPADGRGGGPGKVPSTKKSELEEMHRAAFCARYSSDNQRDASIEDQFRPCRQHAARERKPMAVRHP